MKEKNYTLGGVVLTFIILAVGYAKMGGKLELDETFKVESKT